jgi:hypothetical protein
VSVEVEERTGGKAPKDRGLQSPFGVYFSYLQEEIHHGIKAVIEAEQREAKSENRFSCASNSQKHLRAT